MQGLSEGEPKKYINTIAIFRDDGSILKVLYDEKLPTKRDLICEIDNGTLLIFYKDDNSVVKKMQISDILITKNDE